jgi:hypothetical protein
VTATSEQQIEADPVVLRDAFPATVTLNGNLLARTARVAVTRQRVYAWIADGRTPRLILDAPYDPAASIVPRYNAPTGQRTVLATDGGNVLVDRQRGCGCSNPLSRWRPWKPYRIAA